MQNQIQTNQRYQYNEFLYVLFSENKRTDLIVLILGSPRVDGDEEEDEFDDLVNEFDLGNYGRRDPHSFSELSLHSQYNTNNNNENKHFIKPSFDREKQLFHSDLLLIGKF